MKTNRQSLKELLTKQTQVTGGISPLMRHNLFKVGVGIPRDDRARMRVPFFLVSPLSLFSSVTDRFICLTVSLIIMFDRTCALSSQMDGIDFARF